MSHAFAFRGSRARDKSRHRFVGFLVFAPLLQIGASLLFGASSDFADHENAFGLVVFEKELEAIGEVRSVQRIAADADAGRLSEPDLRRLIDRLVGERPRTRDDPDPSFLVNMSRHDANLARLRRDDARAVRTDEPHVGVERERRLDRRHVKHRNALGDADDERNRRVDRLQDGIGSKGRRNEDDAGIRSRFAFGNGERVEDRQPQVFLSPLARRDPSHHLRAVGERLFGMEGSLRTGEALAENARIVVDKNGHGCVGSWVSFAELQQRLFARRPRAFRQR